MTTILIDMLAFFGGYMLTPMRSGKTTIFVEEPYWVCDEYAPEPTK